MTLEALAERYTFHDSLVKQLEWDTDNCRFRIEIDFCNWAQDYYASDMAENLSVVLTFNNVKNVTGYTVKIDYNSIATCEVNDSSIVFWLLRDYEDGDGGIDEVQIWADSVNVEPPLP